jgi:hypothetical protein
MLRERRERMRSFHQYYWNLKLVDLTLKRFGNCGFVSRTDYAHTQHFLQAYTPITFTIHLPDYPTITTNLEFSSDTLPFHQVLPLKFLLAHYSTQLNGSAL